MDKARIKELLHLFAAGNATPSDREELYALYSRPGNEAIVKDLIEEYWNRDAFRLFLSGQQSEDLYQSIKAQLPVSSKRGKSVRFKPWLAAASVLVIIALSWWLVDYKAAGPVPTAQKKGVADVTAPAVPNAHIVTQSGRIKKLAGKADIKPADEPAEEGTTYTLVNPRGSRPVSVTLADGTRAWLNAESSISYPTKFDGAERKVAVTGEVYFEVVHNAEKLFMVQTNKAAIKVLGTHFNVNSFNDKVKVTLLEGKVDVSNGPQRGILTPGQTALIDNALKVVTADTAVAMAWKNAVFDFQQTGLKEIMSEVARWYDVNVEYEKGLPDMTLSGTVNRNINISQVLKMLELSSGLRFSLEDKKIMVSKK